MKILGIVLIAFGIIALAYQGITYTKHSEVLKIGDLKVETTEREHIPLPPILGGLAVVAGVVLILVDKRGRKLI
jgi:UDP-N-acetylmuramyl pentapeptide phosphotransferase/UDP-N-acetylglucosamine-1-phosphate transferase